MNLTELDPGLLKQLPIVAIFLIVVFRIQKENRDYMDKRDKEYGQSLSLLATNIRLMSDRVYGLGLAFVALAGANDPHKGAQEAKKIMEDLARDGFAKGREAGMGYGD